MILSDHDLSARLANGSIKIDPLVDPELQVQPASIDLRLGFVFQTFNYTHQALIDPADPDTFDKVASIVRLEEGDRFIVHPGEFVLGTTYEQVYLPSDLVARLEGRSSVGRLGIVVHSTAGYIDPGFQGAITLEISNLGRIAVALYPGMRICQLVFENLSTEADRPYSDAHKSKYQGQTTTTVSKLFQDEEFIRMQELGQSGIDLKVKSQTRTKS